MEVSGKKKDKSADVLCDMCLLLGKNTKAEHFCADCNEFFCDNCCMVHKVGRYTRNHKLLDSGNMPKQKLESYEDSVCSKHSGKGLEYICKDHNTIFCSVCVTLDHKNCNLLFIDDIATDFDKTPEYKSLIDSIASLTMELQEMKDKSIKKGEELQKSHGKFITDVKAFRKEINQILDTIEGTIMKEADDLKEDHLKLAVSDTAMCDNILADLNIASEKMREQLRYMQHRQLVISAKETEIKVNEYDAKLVEMAQGESMEFKFVPNENLLQSLWSFTTMGGIKNSIAAKGPMTGLQGGLGQARPMAYQSGATPCSNENWSIAATGPMRGLQGGMGQARPMAYQSGDTPCSNENWSFLSSRKARPVTRQHRGSSEEFLAETQSSLSSRQARPVTRQHGGSSKQFLAETQSSLSSRQARPVTRQHGGSSKQFLAETQAREEPRGVPRYTGWHWREEDI